MYGHLLAKRAGEHVCVAPLEDRSTRQIAQSVRAGATDGGDGGALRVSPRRQCGGENGAPLAGDRDDPGTRIIRVVLDRRRVVSQENLLVGKYGRIRAMAEGPDGFIYFSTSNRDGRGSPASDDDRIIRLVPGK